MIKDPSSYGKPVMAIVQARINSTRLPGKVLKEIDGVPLLKILLDRLKLSKNVDRIIVATTNSESDDILCENIKKWGFDFFRGNESDVLDRYYHCAYFYNAGTIVRITGDCPLVDPTIVDLVIESFFSDSFDYCSNISPPSYPDGLDTEVFSMNTLNRAFRESTTDFDREHVTPYIRNHDSFKKYNVKSSTDYSKLRWTIDELSDYEVIKKIIEAFPRNFYFSWLEVLDLYRTKPEIFSENSHIKRNEGMIVGQGQKLWKRAKKVIPGGNMLLSKRTEMFLPNYWPSYFSKSKGCNVWDLDGNKFTDVSIMGIGTNILGYGDDEVDNAVRQVITNGNMSTLNCPEEVYLAEKLLEINSWAHKVRFARTGGEANAIAVRIARAASGKSKIAVCGYHGWHDWYLAVNLFDKDGLDNHLLPGLDPSGVPKELAGTVVTFEYNNFFQLEKLVNEGDIGVIKMEVFRNIEPSNDFLKKVRSFLLMLTLAV